VTRSQRVTAVVVGIAGLAFGAIMIALASGIVKLPDATPTRCANVLDCEKSCASGRGEDCLVVGMAHLQGLGAQRSPDRAVTFLRRACELGAVSGCTALGSVLLDRGPGDRAEARAALDKACDAGDAMGCNNLAALHAHGPDRDQARALLLYEKACTRGSGMGCSSLAKAALEGDGVVKDPARAKVLFSRSMALLQPECERGNARACGQAGWLLERGLGGDQDVQKAVLDYQAGCDGNDGPSCYNLATVRRATGDGGGAKGLFARACTLGLQEGCSAR